MYRCADSKRNCFFCMRYIYIYDDIYDISLAELAVILRNVCLVFSLSLSLSLLHLYLYHFVLVYFSDFRNQCVIEIKYLVNAYIVS